MPEQRILIVDDNAKYAEWVRAVLEHAGYLVDHVWNAKSGVDTIQANPAKYTAVFSDITMEHPGAGLFMVPKLRRLGYQGAIVLVSTGFDYQSVFLLSRFTLGLLGVDGLVVKRELLQHGRWHIKWITQKQRTQDLRQTMAAIQSVPNWEKKQN
ncbi:MAG: response regulator [bacterium]|nr:response regulator [bacterium]